MSTWEEVKDQISGPNADIDFTSGDLLWLGGKEPTSEVLKEYSKYAKMDRNKWNQDIPSGFHFPNPDVQEDYTQIWNGDFHGMYQLSRKKPHTFCLLVNMPSDPFAVMTIKMVLDNTPNMKISTLSNDAFQGNTSKTMKLALAYQVLHHFIRQHSSVLDDEDLSILTDFMCHEYNRKLEKPWMHVLDIAVARLDVALTRKPKVEAREIATLLASAACHLQATGKNALAGHMFTMAATKFADKQSAGFYADAAWAYRLAGQYADAENSCLKALRVGTMATGRIVSDRDIDRANSYLLDTYSVWHWQLKNSQGHDKEVLQTSLVYHTYVGLLYVCKYRAFQSEQDRMAIVRFNNTMLQGKFKKEAAAKNALMLGIQGETADAFRARLLSCLKSSTAQYIPLKSLEGNKDGVETSGKSSARARMSNQKFVGTVCAFCDAGETDEKRHKNCPCGSEKYCSRKCQLAHWKQHKPFCAFAQQQAMKKEQKTSKK